MKPPSSDRKYIDSQARLHGWRLGLRPELAHALVSIP